MADITKKEKGIGRRGFFGAAAAAAATGVVAGGARPAFAEETGDERTKARYQETEHVKAFYRTNRYYTGS
jgi:sugar (pentulose or hexulose) kinase